MTHVATNIDALSSLASIGSSTNRGGQTKGRCFEIWRRGQNRGHEPCIAVSGHPHLTAAGDFKMEPSKG
jgi:hypothetical protein